MRKQIASFITAFILLLIIYYLIAFSIDETQPSTPVQHFVRTQGTGFVLGDQPFKFIGTNLNLDSLKSLDQKSQKQSIKDLVFNGGLSRILVYRIAVDPNNIIDAFLLDQLVSNCEVYSCYVLVSFDGLSLDDPELYKNRLDPFINKYQKSRAIFAWEVSNGPLRYGTDPIIPNDFLDNIISFIKSTDQNHLVIAGSGTFDSSHGPASFIQYRLSQATSDFCVFSLDTESSTPKDIWSNRLKDSFKSLSDCNGKPVVLEYFSISSKMNDQSTRYSTLFEQASINNINPLFSYWSSDNDELSVYTTDKEILSAISDYY